MTENPLVVEIIKLATHHDQIALHLLSTEKHLTIKSVSNERTDVLVATTWNDKPIVINPANIMYAVPLAR